MGEAGSRGPPGWSAAAARMGAPPLCRCWQASPASRGGASAAASVCGSSGLVFCRSIVFLWFCTLPLLPLAMSTTNPEVTETEWDALQRKFGNLPPKPRVVTEEEKTRRLVDSLEEVDVLGRKSLKELKELEDEVEEETLEAYRRRRLAELKRKQKRNRFGEVIKLERDEFVRQVTEASVVDPYLESDQAPSLEEQRERQQQHGTWVVVHMYKDSVAACKQFNSVLERLAKRLPWIKFVKATSTEVVVNYPDTRLPTVLLYYGGNCVRQIVGVDEWGGPGLTEETVAQALRRMKVLEPEDEGSDFEPAAGDRDREDEEDDRSDEERERIRGKGYSSVKLDGLLGKRRL
ncbi:hypothetical protein Efla_001214 [Eimeria flavescens]